MIGGVNHPPQSSTINNTLENSTNPNGASDSIFGSEDFPTLVTSGEDKSHETLGSNRNYLNCLNGSVSSISSSIKLAYEEPRSDSHESFAFFSTGDLEPHIVNCESFVVGYFVEKRLPYGFVKEKLTSLWNTKGDFSMAIYGEQAFMFNFSQEEDRARVLEIGSVQFGSKIFLIRPWTPFIEQQIGTISSVPIWMILRDVPLHLWNALGFSRISSLVGKPIMTDAPTALKTRMAYAKVCVEVDSNCTFPSELPFQIEDKKYVARAEYPWKPSYCSHCRSFGHSNAKCSSNPAPKYKKKWVPKSLTVVAVAGEHEKIIEPPQVNATMKEKEFPVEDHVSLVQENESNLPAGIHVSFVQESESNLLTKEVMSTSSTQPPELLWTYAKKNKKSSKKVGTSKSVEVSYLNPFDVLFEDGELVEHGLNRVSSPNKETEKPDVGAGRTSDEVTIETTKDDQAHEEVPGNDDQTDLEGSETSEWESEDDDIKAKKMKPVVEVSKYKPLDREKGIDKRMQLTGMFKVDCEGRDSEVRNIFNGIADRLEPSKSYKGVANLYWEGVTNNEKLGRGMRTPVPVKKII